jgi:hypothetical protein
MARALSGGATLAVAGGLALFRAWAYFAASTAFLSATSFTAAALLVASAVSLGALRGGDRRAGQRPGLRADRCGHAANASQPTTPSSPRVCRRTPT